MNANRKNRRGLALMLVVIVMAAATVMAFAMLSNASMQAQTGSNLSASITSTGLDQSAADVAMYYLTYPDRADPTLMTTTNSLSFYNPGTRFPSMSLANAATISNVSVSLPTKGTFDVDVTATSTVNGASITRGTRTVVSAPQRYIPKYSLASPGTFTIPPGLSTSSIAGTVRCDGGFANNSGVLGVVTALLFGTTTNPTPSYPVEACPTYSQLNICKYLGNGTYSYGGNTYTAQQLLNGTITTAALSVANPTTNPGNVYYYTGSAGTISANLNFTGTLILTNGSLTLSASSIQFAAKTGYPALIVNKDVSIIGGPRNVKVTGVAWLGGNINGSALGNANLTVTGALMLGSAAPSINTLLGTVKLTVSWPTSAATIDPPTPDVVYVPELCDNDQFPKYVKIVSTSSIPAH